MKTTCVCLGACLALVLASCSADSGGGVAGAEPVSADAIGGDADGASVDSSATDGPTSLDTAVTDTTVTDTTVTDTTVTDTAVPDTAVPDTAVPDSAVTDTTVTDTAVTDTAVTDTAVTDSTSDGGAPADASPIDVSDALCDPVGAWSLDITSAAGPGEGCGADGSPGQQPDNKVFDVELQADGALTGTVAEITEPVPVITVEEVPSESGCALAVTLTVSIVFPPDASGVIDTVTAAYTYDVSEVEGVITGTGSLHLTTITDTGFAKVDCTEAIGITGTFTPDGG